MDSLRVLLVPFHATNLILVGVFSFLLTICLKVGSYAEYAGWFAGWFLQVWVFKYCYVLVEHLAQGSSEPPVLDIDMLSPAELRPWMQAALISLGGWGCYYIGGTAGITLGIVLLALFPATAVVLGFGESPLQAINPLTLTRVIRGLGPFYLALLLALVICGAIAWMLHRLSLWTLVECAIALWCEVAFFSLVGASIYLRRRQLGYEPTRSPERAASRAEADRLKQRARMVDDVFQLVRIGKHVEATAPLAKWLIDSDGEHASKDAFYVAEQSLKWGSTAALNPIGSTLIRHLMRFGRPDAALAVFEILRGRSPTFTMDSAHDLRALAEYAESKGREALAQSMRLETPVYRPDR